MKPPRKKRKQGPPKNAQFTPFAERLWIAFLEEIYPARHKDQSLARFCRDNLPIPGYGKRQLCRVEQWLNGTSIPSGPLATALVVLAFKHGGLTQQGLARLLTIDLTVTDTPENVADLPTNNEPNKQTDNTP